MAVAVEEAKAQTAERGTDTELPGGEPDISLGTELQEEAPFLAEILVDEWTAGTYGTQWHQGIKPLTYEVRGKTGMFHEYATLSLNKKSKMGAMIEAMRHVFGTKDADGKPISIGKGKLVGKKAWFVRREINFGRGQNGDIKVTVMLALKKATEAEIANAHITTTEPSAAEAAPAVSYSEEDIAALLGYLEGKTDKEATRGVLKSDLSQSLKNAVMSGEAMNKMVADGLMVRAADGKLMEPIAS